MRNKDRSDALEEVAKLQAACGSDGGFPAVTDAVAAVCTVTTLCSALSATVRCSTSLSSLYETRMLARAHRVCCSCFASRVCCRARRHCRSARRRFTRCVAAWTGAWSPCRWTCSTSTSLMRRWH
jgi:hypothetical protein